MGIFLRGLIYKARQALKILRKYLEKMSHGNNQN